MVRHPIALLTLALALALPLGGAATGCGADAPIVAVDGLEVKAACGTCVFHMPDHAGCFWAVEIDGAYHAVGGEVPPVDMVAAHAPGGMCTMPRRAIVSGTVRPDGRFLATRFELLPLDGPPAPVAAPHAH